MRIRLLILSLLLSLGVFSRDYLNKAMVILGNDTLTCNTFDVQYYNYPAHNWEYSGNQGMGNFDLACSFIGNREEVDSLIRDYPYPIYLVVVEAMGTKFTGITRIVEKVNSESSTRIVFRSIQD